MKVQILSQWVPQQYCFTCQGCCRFDDGKSIWRPQITKKEIKKKIFESRVDNKGFLKTKKNKTSFICCFLDDKKYCCRIYQQRPFECQLYPFLLISQKNQTLLAVHLACPFIQENRQTTGFYEQVDILKRFFRNFKKEDSGWKKIQEIYFSETDMKEMDILCSL